jgi:hypothetical protein
MLNGIRRSKQLSQEFERSRKYIGSANAVYLKYFRTNLANGLIIRGSF